MSQTNETGRWINIDLADIKPSTLARVRVPGNPKAQPREEDPQMVSWNHHVILETELQPQQSFRIGFISVFNPSQITYLNSLITERFFRLRIGPEEFEPVVFQAFPEHQPLSRIRLEIFAFTTQGSNRWQHIKLY